MAENGTALVTGGAVRIGRSIALRLAADGYGIALHYNSSRDAAEEVAHEIRALGATCSLFQADLADSAQVLALVKTVHQRCPDLNVLVNNASIFERAPLHETEMDLYDRHFDINLKAPFFLTREFAAVCGRGNIINICDSKIESDLYVYSAYILTKKALAELTRLAAAEFGPQIRVNAVCPGIVLPPAGESPEYAIHLAKRTPAGRPGCPEDVARAVSQLLQSDFVTGQLLFIDGGEHLK